MKGEFTIVGVTVPKPYNFEGNTGVSRKISIRTSEGEVVEVKADTEFDFNNFLDEKCTVNFDLKKGGILKAISAE